MFPDSVEKVSRATSLSRTTMECLDRAIQEISSETIVRISLGQLAKLEAFLREKEM